jgi:cellulose synthase/poly-beta-1,6-N-acetylglucosamine synthase-like glycosyltransferase
MTWLLDALLLVGMLPVLLACGYLLLLTVLSRRRPAPPPPEPARRFDLVVPAHNEEAGIARTVENLSRVEWPGALRRILVVADNCSDATAERAREAGARVLERHDTERRGKGYALAYAFERSQADGFAEAVVVIDADTVVSPNLLAAFARRLEDGAQAVQAHYGVMNPTASWRTRLMTVALGMFHKVRSLGREALGVSCGLRGNGMCFTHAVLRQVPHDAFSIVEDLEYGIRLGRAGHRVTYAWEAEVLGEMVSSEKASRSQRRRWEGGRVQMMKLHGMPLLKDAVRQRSGVLLDLAMDVLVPPLSWVVLGTGLAWLAAAGLSWGVGRPLVSLWAASAGGVGVGAYVLRGWWVSGVGARGLLDLMWAPVYVLWKVWLVLRGPEEKKGEWVRTTREAERR